jgi:hypothetical protein
VSGLPPLTTGGADACTRRACLRAWIGSLSVAPPIARPATVGLPRITINGGLITGRLARLARGAHSPRGRRAGPAR